LAPDVPGAADPASRGRLDIDQCRHGADARVVRVFSSLAPWRIAIAPRAFAAIELAANEAGRAGVRVGHRLRLTAA
jgi:uncharacterized membrane protein (UPF0127 family)